MKATVRPLEDTDLPGVGSLRVLAFPDFPEVRDVGFYDSVYRWLGSHPLAGELRRWVAVTGKGEVVGHLSAIPQYYRVGGRRVVAHTPADYMSHPEYGFYAFLLMRKFFGECENCVACDMVPGVIGIETRLGAETAGKLQYAAKLLNVSRLPLPPVPAPARRLLNLPEHYGAPARGFESGRTETGGPEGVLGEQHAPLARPRLPLPAAAKEFLNGGLRVLDRGLAVAFGSGVSAEELDEFDPSFDGFFERVAAGVPCTPEKNTSFLRWRYGPGSPPWPVTILGVRGGERLLGYAVLKTSSEGQDGNIMDLMTLPGRGDVARALLIAAARHFARLGVQIIRYRFIESPVSPTSGDLRRLGFFHRDRRRHTLLVKFADRGLHKTACDTANWAYTIGDGEAGFFVR